MITAYETQIKQMEQDKAIITEKLTSNPYPTGMFDQIYRTVKASLPFKALEDLSLDKSQMVHRSRETSNTRSRRFCETTAATFPDAVETGVSLCEKLLVPLDRETSNTLFEVFEEWNAQLQDVDFISLYDEMEDKIEEPQP